MIEINGKQFCENCFETVTGAVCAACGFNSADNAPDPTMLVPGSVLQNRYVIGRVIGKGGFGITYLAYDALVRRKIAVKEYFPYGLAQRTVGSVTVSVTSADNAEPFRLGAEKFYNEAKPIMRFNGNPNIVGVYDCFYENGTVYMAMEYLHGHTLKEYIREHGVLGAPQALFTARAMAGALVVVHSASILHRDITPDNIIICDNGDIKLIDFGAARQVVAEYSQTFSVILKPGFAPPEQYSKKGNQGAWTDVYSLGTTLYYMLTGDIPMDPSARFDEDDTFKENLFDIEPALWELITKATKLDIGERYADAYELKKALDLVPVKPEPIIVRDESSAPSGTEPSPGAASSGSDMLVSIKQLKPKQSFFRRHMRTIIEAVCGLLVAAIIIPLAVNVYKLSNIASTSDPGGTSAPGSSGTSDPSGMVATIGNQTNLKDIGYKNPLFTVLNDPEKELYSYIYYGLVRSEQIIVIPSATYKVSEIQDIYDSVLCDNPLFNNTQGYNINYSDINNNKQADPDEYVNSIVPIYTGIDPHEANDYIAQTLDDTDLDEKDELECLRFFHDKLVTETEIIQRNSRPSASSTHGAVIDHAADDLGIAKAICDYAQRLGFESFVMDMQQEDLQLAMVRVKVDGEWFNISPRLGEIATNHVKAIPLAEDGKIGHLFFLCNDLFFTYSGNTFTFPKASDEKYLPLLPSAPESEDGFIVNYYFEKHLKIDYHYIDVEKIDDAYNILLEDTKARFNNGEETVGLYIYPNFVDPLWEMMQESYISDLSEKYGITISGFSAEYNSDKMVVTLEK